MPSNGFSRQLFVSLKSTFRLRTLCFTQRQSPGLDRFWTAAEGDCADRILAGPSPAISAPKMTASGRGAYLIGHFKAFVFVSPHAKRYLERTPISDGCSSTRTAPNPRRRQLSLAETFELRRPFIARTRNASTSRPVSISNAAARTRSRMTDLLYVYYNRPRMVIVTQLFIL